MDLLAGAFVCDQSYELVDKPFFIPRELAYCLDHGYLCLFFSRVSELWNRLVGDRNPGSLGRPR